MSMVSPFAVYESIFEMKKQVVGSIVRPIQNDGMSYTWQAFLKCLWGANPRLSDGVVPFSVGSRKMSLVCQNSLAAVKRNGNIIALLMFFVEGPLRNLTGTVYS